MVRGRMIHKYLITFLADNCHENSLLLNLSCVSNVLHYNIGDALHRKKKKSNRIRYLTLHNL